MSEINAHYQGNIFKGVKFDPYLIARIFNMQGGPLEHIMKKSLRGVSKGHTEAEVLKEIICCAERGLEIIELEESKTDEVDLKLIKIVAESALSRVSQSELDSAFIVLVEFTTGAWVEKDRNDSLIGGKWISKLEFESIKDQFTTGGIFNDFPVWVK